MLVGVRVGVRVGVILGVKVGVLVRVTVGVGVLVNCTKPPPLPSGLGKGKFAIWAVSNVSFLPVR